MILLQKGIFLPIKITVKSYPESFKTVKGLSPMYSDGFSVFMNNKESVKITILIRFELHKLIIPFSMDGVRGFIVPHHSMVYF